MHEMPKAVVMNTLSDSILHIDKSAGPRLDGTVVLPVLMSWAASGMDLQKKVELIPSQT